MDYFIEVGWLVLITRVLLCFAFFFFFKFPLQVSYSLSREVVGMSLVDILETSWLLVLSFSFSRSIHGTELYLKSYIASYPQDLT